METSKIFVVADHNVESYARRLYPDAPLLTIAAGEQAKTIDAVLDICRYLLDGDADRDSLLVAVGGGCTSDIAGFAAGIYKRGIRHAICPTTLLSMVDASIGGKTGVNLDGYKNMLGLYQPPYFIKPVYDALETLPAREFRSGMAEMLKTFLIADAKMYAEAVRFFSSHMSGTADPGFLPALRPFIEAAAFMKQEIVDRDPKERGERRLLNLGHTAGHAIEWWQATHPLCTYTHGEAVAIGIVEAARMSEELGICQKGLRDKLKSDFSACGLPTDLPCPVEELEPAISKDKKASGEKVRWILLRRPGKAEVRMI